MSSRIPTEHVILCVDDEPYVLEGLVPALSKKYLVKTATSGPAALDILRTAPPVAVIISDMRMPGMNGAQFLSASRRIVPNARRILLTGHADLPTTLAAVNEGGICRFLTKPCPVVEMLQAIEDVIADSPGDRTRRAALLETAYTLTRTEIDIAELLAEGKSANLIAGDRGVAVGTVRAQIKSIMAKLGVNRQVELVVRLSRL